MNDSLSFESLLLIKIAVSVATVIGLSLVAEHVSPRIAGLLSGYPLGTAIALFFIGYEIGPEFAAEGAVYTLAGFASTLMLTTGYWLSLKSAGTASASNANADQKAPWLAVLAASLLGVLLFVLSGLLIKQLSLTLLSAACLPALAILACIWGYRHIPESQVGKKSENVGLSVTV